MTEKEIDSQQGKWFLAWWGILPTELFSSQTKGSKEKAWQEWKNLKPDRNLCAAIGDYTKKRTAFWRQEKAKGKKMRVWRDGERLIKQKFWADGEVFESKPERARGGLDKCVCGNPIEHVNTCWGCHDAKNKDWRDTMIDGMIR